MPYEELYEYTLSLIKGAKNTSSAANCAIAVGYYSKCLWNTLAPDPNYAQECLTLDMNTHQLKYYNHRSLVLEAYKKPYQIVMFPSYNAKRAAVLYFYDRDVNVQIEKDLHIENDIVFCSPYYNDIVTTITKGDYPICKTIYNDLYYITIKD